MSCWVAKILTIFPEMFPGPLGMSLAGKALDKGLWSLDAIDIRDFATDKHKSVDDVPFGGGAGMVMRADVIDAALQETYVPDHKLVYLSPRGSALNQKKAQEFSSCSGVTLLCGRYEGVDQRVLDKWNFEEISVGDFVLSGGEPAALVFIDACVRLLPEVLASEETLDEESFQNGLLEYSHYTRPRDWEGMKVPEMLLSGNHEKIRDWRLKQSEKVTQERRPDLWKCYVEDYEINKKEVKL